MRIKTAFINIVFASNGFIDLMDKETIAIRVKVNKLQPVPILMLLLLISN